MTILEIPGYADAIARERFLRDAAFLGVTETVCGFELKPMTLRHYLVLRALNSPLLNGGTPDPTELAQFLWMCSADYSLDDSARRRFLKRCRRFTPPPAPFFVETKRWRRRFNSALIECAKCLTAARAYIVEAMIDAPPKRVGSGFQPDYYSEVAFWAGLFDHHYSPDAILDMPLKVLFQLFKEYMHRKSKKPMLFNPLSERVRADWQQAKQRN